MKKLHEQIQTQIGNANASYKARVNNHRKPMVFNLGDLIWLNPRNERFLFRRKNKHLAWGECPFKVHERIGGKAFELDLPKDMHVSVTFTVGDLALYVKANFEHLRLNASQEKEDDAYQALNLLLATSSSTPKSKSTFLSQDDHHSNSWLHFRLTSHHSNEIQLGRSMHC